MVIWQVPAAARVLPTQVSALMAKSLAGLSDPRPSPMAPDGTPPVLVIVYTPETPRVPACCVPNPVAGGVMVSAACVTPVPVTAYVAGPPGVAASTSCPGAAPDAVGLNWTTAVQVAAGMRVVPVHVSVAAGSMYSAEPVRLIAIIPLTTPPPLVTVKVAVIALFNRTGPKPANPACAVMVSAAALTDVADSAADAAAAPSPTVSVAASGPRG